MLADIGRFDWTFSDLALAQAASASVQRAANTSRIVFTNEAQRFERSRGD
jgi:hypothetical protein